MTVNPTLIIRKPNSVTVLSYPFRVFLYSLKNFLPPPPPPESRLLKVPYFPVRSSRSSAMRYGWPSWMSTYTHAYMHTCIHCSLEGQCLQWNVIYQATVTTATTTETYVGLATNFKERYRNQQGVLLSTFEQKKWNGTLKIYLDFTRL